MVVVVLALGIVVVGLLIIHGQQSPIPAAIERQANFAIMYPDGSAGYDVAANTVSYNSSANGLIFHVRNKSGLDVTVTEQATPAQFDDIPQYYPTLIEKLRGYGQVDSVNGKVDLTHPVELNGAQSAVFNGKGVLMFARPSRDMSEGDWLVFFNSLVLAPTR
jgi:hypothetical protein